MSIGREKGAVCLLVYSTCVCVRVCACRGGRVLAGHLMIFAMAALSECCCREKGDALHKLKRHAILPLPAWEEKVPSPVSPDMRIFSH